MLHEALLAVHVSSGVTGLALGPIAYLVRRRSGWHRPVGRLYLAVVGAMTSSALGLVAFDPGRLWGLGTIAAATAATAAAGWWVRRRRSRGWLPTHIRLMGGSYLSFVTAALVVSWSSPVAWVLPTLVGAPAITLAVQRATRRQPPLPRPGDRLVPTLAGGR